MGLRINSASGYSATLVADSDLTEDVNIDITSIVEKSNISSTVKLVGDENIPSTTSKGLLTFLYEGDAQASKPLVTGVGSIDFTVPFNGSGFYIDRSGGYGNEVLRNDAGILQDLSTPIEWAFANNQFATRIDIKGRSFVELHAVFDSLRGANNFIRTNDDDIEGQFGGGGLVSFDSNGVTVGSDNAVNNNTEDLVLHQEAYTHGRAFLVNGQLCVTVWNPITKCGMRYRLGSNSVADVWSPFKIDYSETKRLNGTANGTVFYGDKDNKVVLYAVDGSVAKTATPHWNNTEPTINSFTFGSFGDVNVAGGVYVDYFFGNSEFKKVINYSGQDAGTEIDAGWPVSRCTVKSITVNGSNWPMTDNQRGDDLALLLNQSVVEDGGYNMFFTANGVRFDGGSDGSTNKAGEEFIAIVERDTASNGGGTDFDWVADGEVLNYLNAGFTSTDGLNPDGTFNKLSEVIASGSVDFSGVSDGLIYWAKEYKLNSHVFSAYRPTFIFPYNKISALDNRPAYVNGKWYHTSGGELVTNGNFDTDISGWTAVVVGGDATLSNENQQLKITSVSSNDYGAIQYITTNIGETYKLSISISAGTVVGRFRVGDGSSELDDSYYLNNSASVGTYTLEFTATTTSTNISLGGTFTTGGQSMYYDNVSVFKKEATLGAVYTNQPSWARYPVVVASETPQRVATEITPLSTNVTDSLEVLGRLETNDNVKIIEFGFVFNNQSLTKKNPFGNENWAGCSIEVYINLKNEWVTVGGGAPQSGTGNAYAGIVGGSLRAGIRIQTGSNYVTSNSNSYSLNTGDNITTNVASAECIVVVTYNGKVKDA